MSQFPAIEKLIDRFEPLDLYAEKIAQAKQRLTVHESYQLMALDPSASTVDATPPASDNTGSATSGNPPNGTDTSDSADPNRNAMIPPRASSEVQIPQECDLVLKGGITSGVVYPLAICEIATHYRLKNLGGTSAGAIAAALAAAAELGRTTPGAGFVRLAKIPEIITEADELGRTKLMRLFQPRPRLRVLFNSLLRLINLSSYWQVPEPAQQNSNQGLLQRLGTPLKFRFPLMRMELTFTSIFAMVSSWVFQYLKRPSTWVLFSVGIAFVFVLPLELIAKIVWIPLSAAMITLALMLYDFFEVMPNEHFGMCGGARESKPQAAKPPGATATGAKTPESQVDDDALSDWLHDQLNLAAFGQKRNVPLTFGELWSAPNAANTSVFIADQLRRIDLSLLTTCASHGRSYTLPLNSLNLKLFFHPDDMRRLVPAPVVAWLMRGYTQADARKTVNQDTVYPMPPAADWPVVLAVRMSLSFPVLFSMVRFYTENRQGQFWPIWFTDGGLASNFPIHLYDDPIPPRPTFAINLRGLEQDEKLQANDCLNIEFWKSPANGLTPRLPLIPVRGMPGFFGRVLDSMQNWSDNSLVNLIGYRDRIVHVKLAHDEGGMNLNMNIGTINRLRDRGWAAGRLLVERFADGQSNYWALHRQDRLGIAISGAQQWVQTLARDYNDKVKVEIRANGHTSDETTAAVNGLDRFIEVSRLWEEQGFARWLYTDSELTQISDAGSSVNARVELRNRANE
jgi:predicted acylesterase/phospholipase RssA